MAAKKSDAHKAAAVSDPFMDTTGPSLHVLIKLLAITSKKASVQTEAFGL